MKFKTKDKAGICANCGHNHITWCGDEMEEGEGWYLLKDMCAGEGYDACNCENFVPKYSKQMDAMMVEINKIANDMLNPSGRGDGTSTYYIQYKDDKRKVCYTKQRTWHNGKKKFYSWVYLYNKKNRNWKMTRLAGHGTSKNARARATKLGNEYRIK